MERANNTLQDRLVKELRYFNITSIKEGNKFLKQYINEYNRKFSIKPKNPTNLHVELTNRECFMLENIFAVQTLRKINKKLIIKHNNVSYLIINVGKGHRYINQRATVCELPNGKVHIFCQGKQLQHLVYADAKYKPTFANRKNIDQIINQYHFLIHSQVSNNTGYNYHD